MGISANSNPLDDIEKLRRNPHALASWQNAQRYLNNGRHVPAQANFRGLVQKFPGVPQLWAELGAASAGNLDFSSAEQAFQRATELASANASMLVALGAQYYHLRRLDQALACFQRAVEVEPSSIQFRLNLAAWLERCGRVGEAVECVETCLSKNPQDGGALYFKAFLLHRQGRNDEAEAALRDLLKDSLLPAQIQADANHLLGVVLDASGQYAEVLTYLDKAKAARTRMVNVTAIDQAAERSYQSRRKLLEDLTPQMMLGWREEANASPCPHRLALLAGVMRSGTTLIEQILGAHSEALIFDESMNSLKELIGALDSPPTGQGLTLKSLNDLPPGARADLTGRYFKSLLRETRENTEGKLLLDKNPSTTSWLHVWLRLFPQSKIIIALRDPRDVIISCYFQNFPKDWAIASFRTLEQTARFYAHCTDAWLRMRELGGFEWIESRYEDVVANLAGEGRRVTNFLGLPWQEGQAAYHKTTSRKFVHSPTYAEVKKPVYTRAVGRWEHYAEALHPLQASLEPYFKAFGYPQ